jgi:creatinine amidohydrolase
MIQEYDPQRIFNEVPIEPIPDEVQAVNLRPGELLARQAVLPVAFQPIGTLEWHGRQNPIGCDTIKADRLCIETAKRTGGVVMPPIYFSVDTCFDAGFGLANGMDATAGFPLPGSFYRTDPQLFQQIMINACENYLSHGFEMVFLVSGHNPKIQEDLLHEVCYRFLDAEGKEPVVFTMEYQTIEEGNPRRGSDHAGFYETSMMLYLNPDRVKMDANKGMERPDLGIGTHRPVQEATAEEGKQCFLLQVDGFEKIVQERFADWKAHST